MENGTLELNSCSGSGSGSGYGSGYGDGSGYGSGYGDGYGYVYGSGDGYGDGYGSGDGYGDGYGSGDGYGYGDNREAATYFLAILNQEVPPDTIPAFWRSDLDGLPANGGSALPAHEGLTQEVDGPLTICTPRALHGTTDPRKWNGERWWIVALHEPVVRQEDKIASLKRTIVKDLGKCPFQ